ncbi:hypothetical protein TNCV_5106381 [Trichonephila clavipes]|nr:hypothetical protein TNCV_5106381 [Trichonephila clavipes]
MAAIDFLHHGNPPIRAKVEPATLGAEGQGHPAGCKGKDKQTKKNLQKREAFIPLEKYATELFEVAVALVIIQPTPMDEGLWSAFEHCTNDVLAKSAETTTISDARSFTVASGVSYPKDFE